MYVQLNMVLDRPMDLNSLYSQKPCFVLGVGPFALMYVQLNMVLDRPMDLNSLYSQKPCLI